VRAPDPTQPMSFFACCSRTFRRFNISVPYKPRILGSSAYSFCLVARGSALLGFDATPKIWDLSAVWLLVEEAGGIIQSFEDVQVFPLGTNIDYSTTSFSTLAAANPDLLEQGHNMIQRK
jgi:myo-inositol-1(or 4)-monophosphatase